VVCWAAAAIAGPFLGRGWCFREGGDERCSSGKDRIFEDDRVCALRCAKERME
jgi:hypothetical protein